MSQSHRNALKPGHRVHWYEILEILGQGGFGITYLARDTNLDRKVAIKEYLPVELAVREADESIHPVSADHSGMFTWGLGKFIEEARTLAQFKHPNIVRVHTVFEAHGTAYMVMEFEAGDSLQQRITDRGRLPENELLRILFPILDGLELVHAAGFIHRDIKPANIFIRADGSPVLLDFGSSRQAMSGATRTLTGLVSPGYAPFEQYVAKSNQQRPWTDLYGLAATLYRAASGNAPEDAMSRSEAILQNQPDPFVSASEALAGYSGPFIAAIEAALQFQPIERPQTIAAWRAMFAGGASADADASDRDAFGEQATALVATRFVGSEPTTGTVAADAGVAEAARAKIRIRILLVLLALAIAGNIYWYSRGRYTDSAPGYASTSGESAQISIEERKTALLREAHTHLSAGRLHGAGENNALAQYRLVLLLDPDNEAASTGLREIAAMLITRAREAIDGNRLDEAEAELERAASIAPGHPLLVAARGELYAANARHAERQALDDLYARALEDIDAGRLLNPPYNNAVARARALRSIAPEDSRATAIEKRVADALARQGEQALGAGEIELARERYEQARDLYPASDAVEALGLKIKAPP